MRKNKSTLIVSSICMTDRACVPPIPIITALSDEEFCIDRVRQKMFSRHRRSICVVSSSCYGRRNIVRRPVRWWSRRGGEWPGRGTYRSSHPSPSVHTPADQRPDQHPLPLPLPRAPARMVSCSGDHRWAQMTWEQQMIACRVYRRSFCLVLRTSTLEMGQRPSGVVKTRDVRCNCKCDDEVMKE